MTAHLADRSGTVRRPSLQELRDALAEHERWLTSDGREGTRAFAEPLDLTGTDLRGANLARANLFNVDFRTSNLEGANMAGARGLTPERVAGANLADAQVPESLAKFETLSIVDELAKSCRATLFALLGASAYCWLTIGTTLDVRLLANTATSPLPILQTNVPIATFYWVVPTALLVGYAYLQLQLRKLCDALGALPAVFPNGVRREQRVNSWPLATTTGAGGDRRPVGRFRWLEQMLAEFITWWFIPLTLSAFWLRYLSRHDWRGSALHVVLLSAAVWTAYGFRTIATASDDARPAWLQRFRLTLAAAAAVVLLCGSFSVLALATNQFELYGAAFFPDLRGAHLSGENLRGVDMRQAAATGARLDGADLRDARLDGVSLGKANLRLADLRSASLSRATLTRADLRGAQMQEATMSDSQLENTSLREAKLQDAAMDRASLAGADLRDTTLEGASLRGANLQGVRFNKKTNLQDAHLEGADLRKVDLRQGTLAGAYLDSTTKLDPASLRGATLTGAMMGHFAMKGLDIRKADLKRATLDQVELVEVRGGKQTHFDGALLHKATFERTTFKGSVFNDAKLQDSTFSASTLEGVHFKNADLQRVTFKGVKLEKADFEGARLEGAVFQGMSDLTGASFKNARLEGASLRDTTGLTQKQLDDACGDSRTQLPEAAKPLQIKACAPLK